MSSTHIIGRQRFRIQVSSMEEADFVHGVVGDLTRNQLLPQLEQLLDEIAGPEVTVRIERLHLNVGELSREDFTNQLVKAVIIAMGHELKRFLPPKAGKPAAAESPLIRSAEHTTADTLIHFLRTGTMPWWWKSEAYTLSPHQLLASALADDPAYLLDALRELPQQMSIVNRLRMQFKAPDLTVLNKHLWARAWPAWQSQISLLLDLLTLRPPADWNSGTDFHRLLLAIAARLGSGFGGRERAEGAARSLRLLTGLSGWSGLQVTVLAGHFAAALDTSLTSGHAPWPKSATDDLRRAIDQTAGDANRPPETTTGNDVANLLAYLERGRTPPSGYYRTAGALEQLLALLLATDADGFQAGLRRLLRRSDTNQRLHQRLRKPGLRVLQQWLWGRLWGQVQAYLQDVQSLTAALGIPRFSAETLQRRILAKWSSSAPALHQDDFPARGMAQRDYGLPFWRQLVAGIPALLARESGLSTERVRAMIENWSKERQSTGTDSQTNLSELLAVSEGDPGEDGFTPNPAPRAVELFRFYLERGYLPEPHGRDGLAALDQDLRRRALRADTALFAMLSETLKNSDAMARFRRETTVATLYALARTAAWRASGYSPDWPAEKDGGPTKASSATEETMPTDLAFQQAPHPALRRPANPPGAELSWAYFFHHLGQLYPGDISPAPTNTTYQRQNYAFIVKGLLVANAGRLPLAATLKQWVAELAREYRQPPTVIIQRILESDTASGIPSPLAKALGEVGALSETVPRDGLTEGGAVAPSAVVNDPAKSHGPSPEVATARYWASVLTGQTIAEETRLPEAAAFSGLLSADARIRAVFLAEIKGKKARPGRFISLADAAGTTNFLQAISTDLAPGGRAWFTDLKRLVITSQRYASAAEATDRLHHYALLILPDSGTSEAHPHRFLERIIALVAREHGQTTAQLATDLLGTKPTTHLPVGFRNLLNRLIARLGAADRRRITDAAEDTANLAKKMPSAQRTALLYRRALASHLRNGFAPWWDAEALEPGELFLRALRTDQEKLRTLLNKDPRLSELLYPFLSITDLAEFVRVASGGYDELVFAWVEAMAAALRNAGHSGSERDVWRPVWAYLLGNRIFSSTAFVRSVLNFGGTRVAIAPEVLRRAVSTEVNERAAGGNLRFYRLAAILREESAGDEDQPSAGDEPKGIRPVDTEALRTGADRDFFGTDAGMGGKTRSRVRPDLPGAKAPADQPPSAKKEGAESTGDGSSGNKVPAEAGQSDDENREVPNYAEELAERVSHLTQFLLYGTPPAGEQSWSRPELETEQFNLLRKHPDLAAQLYRTILADRPARERINRFFGVDLWREIIRTLVPNQFLKVTHLYSDLRQLLPGVLPHFRTEEFRRTYFSFLLAYPATRVKNAGFTEFPEDLIDHLARKHSLRITELFSSLQAAIAPIPPGLNEDWLTLLEKIRTAKITAAAGSDSDAEQSKYPPVEDSLYVHNAGLVILAAFLPRYFQMLNMLEDGAFPDEETAGRAVMLSQYLVSGQTETPEHLLVFNKLICGLDIATPVPESIEISEGEEEASRQLLNAVLQNWDKMSNSSVENLRASFLLREGLLREYEDHFALNVEPRGFDVILSFLPWTISVINLSWMGKRLETYWKTSMA